MTPHLKFNKNLRKWSNFPENLSNQSISTGQSWIHGCANTNKASWHSKLQLILLGVQRDYPGVNWRAFNVSTLIFNNNPGTNLDKLIDFKNTLPETERTKQI